MRRAPFLLLLAAGAATAAVARLQARRPFRTSPPPGWDRGLDGRRTLFHD